MLFVCLISAVVFGLICSNLGRDREVGTTAGFFWGFFLGLIGLIIVLNSRKLYNDGNGPFQASVADELRKYKALYDSGAISAEEYHHLKNQLL